MKSVHDRLNMHKIGSNMESKCTSDQVKCRLRRRSSVLRGLMKNFYTSQLERKEKISWIFWRSKGFTNPQYKINLKVVRCSIKFYDEMTKR